MLEQNTKETKIKMIKPKGLIHLYYGDGKGKTSSSLGVALRAIGHGYRVLVIQFMKGRHTTGEYKAKDIIDNFDIQQFGTENFINIYNPSSNDKERALKGLAFAEENINKYDIVILDELGYAVEFGLVELEKVVELLKKKPEGTEVIITGGRNPPKELLEIADYVSHVVMEKHPFLKGISAREGIDF